MHPVIIMIPAAALVLAPRLWVNHVLKQYNNDDESLNRTGAELARELLDWHDLPNVKVELTDLGDHYDPDARAVRLARDKFDHKSLTAMATAAHEVSHALQHAEHYQPFVWRRRLAKAARVTGEAGFVLLLTIPIAAMTDRQPLPPEAIGAAVLAMLGTGMTAQFVAIPSELDASFNRALPLLRDGYIAGEQVRDVRKILVACSLTYIASSLISVLNIWPWFGRRPSVQGLLTGPQPGVARSHPVTAGRTTARPFSPALSPTTRTLAHQPETSSDTLLRLFAKPLIRGWLRLSRSV
jgi:Zn-dependent membrane protease YugP